MYHSIAPYYDDIFPQKSVQVNFVKGLKARGSWLDIGCGTGNLIAGAGKQFQRISGIDLDGEMIEIARKKVSGIDFRTLNMLDIGIYGEKMFDLITCFGNTIPHLANLDQIEQLIAAVALGVKPGGIFALQVINYHYILEQKIDGLPTIENDYIRFQRDYLHQNGLILFQTELLIKGGGEVIRNEIPLYPVTELEIRTLLERYRFQGINCYGGFDLKPLQKSSIPLIITAIAPEG